MVVETLSLDTINVNSLQSLLQTLQTLQKLRVGTERIRSWYGAGYAQCHTEYGSCHRIEQYSRNHGQKYFCFHCFFLFYWFVLKFTLHAVLFLVESLVFSGLLLAEGQEFA